MLELTSTSELSPRPNVPQLSEAFSLADKSEVGLFGGYIPTSFPPPPTSPLLL